MKRFLSVFAIIILFSPLVAFGQATDYVIGTPSGSNTGTSYPAPFANWFWGTRQQYLILASELQAAGASKGDITEIAFNVLNLNSNPPLQNYTVWVKTTSNSPSLLAWEANMGNPVYGPTTFSATQGWNGFSFPKISWNGSDNIVIEICSNNTGYLTNGNASTEWVTGLPFNASRTYYSDAPGNCGNPGSNLTGNANRPIIRVRIEPPFLNDATPLELNLPGLAICNSSKDIAVSFQNTGIGNLNSLQFGWTVIRNGVSFPISNYNWNGNLAPQKIESNVAIGTFAPGFQNADIIKFWTANPNNVPDSAAENDTISIQIRDGISGVYNVGGIFNIDFINLDLATNYIDSFGAVCDSLIFNVRDGVYYGQLSLNDVINTTPNNPIIIRGENGSNSNVIIEDSTILAGNFVFKINQTSNVYFENITFKNLSKGTNNRVITLENGSENTHFIGCKFENLYSGTSTSSAHSLIYTSNQTLEHGTTILNSTLTGGNFGFFSGGKNIDTTESNIYIHATTFSNQTIGGVWLSNVENIQIHHSNFSSSSNIIANSTAITVNGNVGSLEIFNNSIGSANGWPSKGLNLLSCYGIPSKRGNIYNNSIAVGNGANISANGINSTAGNFLNFINNTIAINGSNSNSLGIFIDGGGANNVINNNIANFAGGLASNYQEVSGFPVFESNHNNFYSTGSNITKHKTNLYSNIASWSLSIGDDNNSISTNPNFFTNIDLHVCGSGLNNAGKPMPMVNLDIDGHPRNMQNPDIGSDEFSPINNLDLGNDTVVCKGTQLMLSGSLNYNDIYTAWSTGDSASGLIVSKPGSYSVISENICGISSDTIVIGLSPSANLGPDTNICANESLMLMAGVSNGQYSWNTGEITNSKMVSQSGIYSITVVDADNCTTTDTIFVTQSQKVDLPNDTSLCGGKSIFLDPKTGPGNYAWSNGATSPIVLATISGNYSVTYTDLFSCSSNGSVNVVSTTLPDANFTDSSVVYTTIFSSTFYPNATYLWDFGDGKTSTQQNPIHLYPGAGNYVVTLQITNDCGADFYSKENVVAVGLNENEIGNLNISISPNPADNHFIITNYSGKPLSSLKIYNLEGKLIFENSSNLSTLTIETSTFAKGVYSIEIKSDEEISNKKLIIQ